MVQTSTLFTEHGKAIGQAVGGCLMGLVGLRLAVTGCQRKQPVPKKNKLPRLMAVNDETPQNHSVRVPSSRPRSPQAG